MLGTFYEVRCRHDVGIIVNDGTLEVAVLISVLLVIIIVSVGALEVRRFVLLELGSLINYTVGDIPAKLSSGLLQLASDISNFVGKGVRFPADFGVSSGPLDPCFNEWQKS